MNETFWNASELSWSSSPTLKNCETSKAVVALYCFIVALCAINMFLCFIHRTNR